MTRLECAVPLCDSPVQYQSDTDDEFYCEDCYHNNFIDCERCGCEIKIDCAVIISDINERWCPDCCDYLATYCEQCEEHTKERHTHGPIYEYGEWPLKGWVFYKTQGENKPLYLGFELEVENGNEPKNHKYTASKLNEKYFHCTWDSSLNDGFEIKTHPMSFNFIKTEGQEIIQNLSNLLKNEKYKSNRTETCGFHIHLSRRCFTKIEEMKLVHLYADNEEFFCKIGQRKPNNYCRKPCKKKYLHGRNAINFTANTIELRFPKGNIRFDRIMKNIELAEAMYAFVKSHNILQMKETYFIQFISKNYKRYKFLVDFVNYVHQPTKEELVLNT